MPEIIFNKFFEEMVKGSTNLMNNEIRCALMTADFSPDKDQDFFDNTHEISGSGYNAGGLSLENKAIIEDDAGDGALFSADDMVWPASTLSARWAVLYDATNQNCLIAAFDFGADKITDNADFVIDWHSSGIFSLKQGE